MRFLLALLLLASCAGCGGQRWTIVQCTPPDSAPMPILLDRRTGDTWYVHLDETSNYVWQTIERKALTPESE